jgi:hypothetical protein
MKPGGARQKGQEGEREVIKLLSECCGEDITLKRNLMQSMEGGYDIVGLDWLALEVKRQETLDIENWWKQTLRQAGDTRIPVLLYRQNRKQWYVVMWGQIGQMRCRVTVNMLTFKLWLMEEVNNRSRTG